MVASSVASYYKHILKRPYDLPSKLYPRKGFKLPNVMTEREMLQLIHSPLYIKQKAIVELFCRDAADKNKLHITPKHLCFVAESEIRQPTNKCSNKDIKADDKIRLQIYNVPNC